MIAAYLHDNDRQKVLMDHQKEELAERLHEVSNRLSRQMKTPSLDEWSQAELTIPQLRTLVLLNDGPQRMGEIAAYLGTSLSATTAMIERLETKQLVERGTDPSDRRVVTCRLTLSGRAEAERLWKIHEIRLAAVVETLDLAELKQVVDAMELMASAFERRAQPIATASADR
jgi:DNA-binding MarR family transcriptional regulator